jgi:signal peptidase I
MLTELVNDKSGNEIWLDSNSNSQESNILLTISSLDDEKSIFVSGNSVIQMSAVQLVDSAATTKPIKSKSKVTSTRTFMTWSGYVVATILLTFSAMSMTGVMKARIVLTGSMEPAISAGDIIITTPIKYRSPMTGDVVAYQARRFNGEKVAVFSHRIIGGDLTNGFIVKGDANKTPDNQRPKENDILGVVIFVIPFVGNFLTPKALFLLIPFLFGAWLVWDAVKNLE